MFAESFVFASEGLWGDEPSLLQYSRRISVFRPGDRGRLEAEAFIRDRFRQTHAARIETFMPSLLGMTDRAGMLRAVAGWRNANEECLFLERYLSQPIEAAIAATCRSQVERSQIVEVGNFACANARTARAFMGMLSFFLLDQQFRWIAFTATSRIRAMLEQMAIRCLDLGPADGACVANCVDDWGRYYQAEPRVMAGFLPMARSIPDLRAANAD